MYLTKFSRYLLNVLFIGLRKLSVETLAESLPVRVVEPWGGGALVEAKELWWKSTE